MKSIVLFTNILTPYRVSFFDKIDAECKKRDISFSVLVMTETEENRSWKYDEYKRKYTTLLDGKRLSVGGFKVNINCGLGRILDDRKPDLIIAAGSYIHPSLWMLIRETHRRSIPVFFWSESHLNTVRNYGSLKIRFRETIRSVVYRKFDGFLYAGQMSKQFIEKYCKENAEKIFLPNLIDNVFFSERVIDADKKCEVLERLAVKEGNRVFIISARLSEDKGIIPFLNELVAVNSTKPYVILIAGEGDKKTEIEKLIQREKLPVKLLGYKSQQEMRMLYQIADAFILPSVVDPNPLTCIEALWSGLPMLVSEHVGNYPEVIQQGQNGYVFSYEKDACEVIERFFNEDEKWWVSAGEKSYQIAKRYYNEEEQVIRILTEIDDYVNRSRKR